MSNYQNWHVFRLLYLTVTCLVVAGLLLSGCSSPPDSYRYQITVEVETPQGPVSGSTIREITYRDNPFAIIQKGEAVILDLPDDRTVYVPMETDTRDLHFATFYWDEFARAKTQNGFGTPEFKKWLDKANETRQLFTLPESSEVARRGIAYPRIAYFDNESDPLTVRLANADQLESILGAGHRLKRITVQMTDEPVTSSIEYRLTWLRSDQLNILIKESREPSGYPLFHHNFLKG